MKQMTVKQIGKIVRQTVLRYTNKKIQALHPDARLYRNDAAGEYKPGSTGNNLGINIGELENILLDLEEVLKISFGFKEAWGDKAQFDCLPIKYHKDTRLHHLIDFVHDSYNKYASSKPKDTDTATNKADSDKTDLDLLNKEEMDFFFIKIIKNNVTMYVRDTEESGYAFTTNKNDLSFFESTFIKENFDLLADDVIADSAASTLKDFLAGISSSFEMSFIRLKEVDEGNNWTYTEDDRITQILNNSNMSDEDRALIQSRLK